MKVYSFAVMLLAAILNSTPSAAQTVTAKAPEVIVIVRYTAQPGKESQALSAITELVAKVKSVEPENGGISILRDVADKSKITLIEKWPSQQLFLGPHMAQPHIQQFIQRSREFLVGPPDITFWNSP